MSRLTELREGLAAAKLDLSNHRNGLPPKRTKAVRLTNVEDDINLMIEYCDVLHDRVAKLEAEAARTIPAIALGDDWPIAPAADKWIDDLDFSLKIKTVCLRTAEDQFCEQRQTIDKLRDENKMLTEIEASLQFDIQSQRETIEKLEAERDDLKARLGKANSDAIHLNHALDAAIDERCETVAKLRDENRVLVALNCDLIARLARLVKVEGGDA